MNVEIRDPRFTTVVGSDVQFEQIVSGCLFTEGPIWQPNEQYLQFSDIPASHVRRWTASQGVRTVRQPSNMTNGMTWDRSGNVLACEHSSSQVVRIEPDGSISPLATHFNSRQLNSPNDVVCAPDGAIYFTDPPYGRASYYGVPRDQELAFQGVYRVGLSPTFPELLVDDFDRPNGLCFSLDQRHLFINDTARQHIRIFTINSNGVLTGGQEWAKTQGQGDGAPDGMKIDSAGNVYCCGPGGIHVFNGDATCLGVIRVPEYTANMTWGDADLQSLYITASTSVYRIRVKIPGLTNY
jgi:gluconolactonase